MDGTSLTHEDEHFTLVFEGSIRRFDRNPFATDTPFGVPMICGVGNAFSDLDEAKSTVSDLLEALNALHGIYGPAPERDDRDPLERLRERRAQVDAAWDKARAAIAKAEVL